MKVVVYTGSEPTLHCDAGVLNPGPNEIYDDQLAEQLLVAGRASRQFLAPEDLAPAVDPAEGKDATKTIVEELASGPAVDGEPQPNAPASRRRT